MHASDRNAGLYLHLPFCDRVCPYCDFAVLIAGPDRRASYLEAVAEEARRYGDCGLRFDTVYLGGGTPSALTDEQLARLLELVGEQLTIADSSWLYLEANPEHVTLERAAAWRRLGFKTVSLGVQSFNDRVLATLGRRHSAAAARRAVDSLKIAGFHTVAADLIYGIEGQRAADWGADLDAAVALEVDHLSCYQLSIHDRTVFGKRVARGEMGEVSSERQRELFELTHRRLADAGLEAYEVSNFAAGMAHRSRHNQKYWQHVPYLGLGPSAHSFRDRRRWWNEHKLRLWDRALHAGDSPVAGAEELSDEDLVLECLMLGFRTPVGIDLAEIEARFGIPLGVANRGLVDSLLREGLVVADGSRLQPTLAGLAVADSLAAAFEIRS